MDEADEVEQPPFQISEYQVVAEPQPFQITVDRIAEQWKQEQQDVRESFADERRRIEQEYREAMDDVAAREKKQLLDRQRQLQLMVEALLSERREALLPKPETQKEQSALPWPLSLVL